MVSSDKKLGKFSRKKETVHSLSIAISFLEKIPLTFSGNFGNFYIRVFFVNTEFGSSVHLHGKKSFLILKDFLILRKGKRKKSILDIAALNTNFEASLKASCFTRRQNFLFIL